MYGQYETIFASRNETFQQIAAPGDLFIILFFFFFTFSPFMHHVKHASRNSRFTPKKKGAYHAITPCTTFAPSHQLIFLFHKSRPEKGVNIPMGVPQ